MPNDPSRPNWRGEDRSALPGGRKPGAGSQYSWKTSGDPATVIPPARKIKATLAAGLGILCLAGLVWLVLLLTRTRPTCLTVVAADFRQTADDLSLPLNIYGDRASRDFLAFVKVGDRANWCGILGDRAAPWPVDPSRRESDWLRGLAGRRENTLIIFVAQPGTTDDQGRPVIITETGGRLEVLKILDELKKLPDKKKLLIFDSTQVPSDWRRGWLLNQFADGLVKIKAEIAAVPNLLILSASAPNQRSWVSEEFGHSIFTHYVLDGLAGGSIGGKKGGPVYAADLFKHVKTKTDQWVQRNRADSQRPFRQTPMLLPEGAEDTAMAQEFLLGYGDPQYAGETTPSLRPMDAELLKSAWKRSDELAAKVPAPDVSTPRIWRRYRELLLRYEALLRAGETDAAGKLRTTLDGLAARIDDSRAAPGAVALPANLAMPAALGRDRAIADVQLAELADKRTEEIATGLKALGGDETVARSKFMGFLLKRIIETPAQLSDLSAKIVSADDGGKNRPAEAHLAVMLNKYQQPGWRKPADDLISLVLKTRQLAEQTALSVGLGDGYPYSERLPGGLWAELRQADKDRRQGEDLLFSSASHHVKGREFLDKAQKRYDDIRKLTAPVRTALSVRDHVFANLQGLTDWAALARPTTPTPPQIESLWAEAHLLADRLARLDPLDPNAPPARDVIDAPRNEPNGRDLATQADIVRQGFDELKSTFDKAVAAEVQSNITTQTARQQIEYVLAAPTIKAEDRVRLVTRSRDISAKLVRETPPPISGETISEADLARNQPRYARAVLGAAILNAMSDTALRKADELKDDRDTQLGLQLFAHWKKLIAETDRATREDTAKTPIPLPWRERLGLIAGTATAPPPEPAELARGERWRGAFRRLASRVELDQWYDEKNQPDFKRLAEMFYRAVSENEFAEQAGKLENLRVRGQLIVNPPAERTLTTERNLAPKFDVRALPETMEPGYATLTPSLNRTDILRFENDVTPFPVSLVKDVQERISLSAIKPLDTFAETPDLGLLMTAYYRGQFAKQALAKLPVRPFPDLTVNKPKAQVMAQVAARADDDLDLGAIAIIFDCSGSMGLTPEDEAKKLIPAKNALKQFQSLLPQGTLVSLWVYGHAQEDPNAENIKQFLPLTKWDKNDPRKSNLLYEQVQGLKARHLTPLLDTMVRAVEDPAFKEAPGFKTLLVLTDGCDQLEKPRPDEEVADQFRQQFVNKKRDVSIQMVLFQLGEKDRRSAAIQFKDLKSVPTPSAKYEAENAQQLFEQLAMSIRPRVGLYRNNRLAFDEFLAKRLGDPLDWHPVPPLEQFGEYDVMVRGFNRKIILEPGDRIALRIKRAPNGVLLIRLLQADDPDRTGVRVLDGLTEDAPYVLSLVNNRIDENGTNLKARFALEDRRAARSEVGFLRLDRPRFVWWEFKAVGTPTIPPRSFVTALSGQPAPTWEIGSERWPLSGGNRQKPAVEVWASPSDPPAADVREIAPGDIIVDAPADGNAAIIESVAFEDIDVPINSDGALSRQNCLVVRVHAPGGGKYIAEVNGEVYAESHRYFFDAKRYTAAFWLPVDAKQKPLRLKLISVEAAKTKATRLHRELVE